jgi:RNA polymerase sigma-70 factor (ECF subfamily)
MSGTATVDDVDDALEGHRRELTGYCYRMLGSGSEAEDAVQETMVRAWRAQDRFEGRSSLRSWLYRIATNVCLDMVKSPQRRARPMDLGPASKSDGVLDAGLAEHAWIMPVRDVDVLTDAGDPGEVAAARESVRLAFVATLQYLPPRQRAVLILRDVLRWQASEVAELLETSVASVNSALQRAHATIDGTRRDAVWPQKIDLDDELLVARYVDAFERYDVDELVALLHEDAIQSMPPFALWLRGRDEIGHWFTGQGAGCEGARLVPTHVNGCPAFGSYRVDPDGGHMPFSIQVLEISNSTICGYHHFLYPELFPAFGLPDHLD